MEKTKERLIQVINLLPETKKKVDYYKASLSARMELYNFLSEKVKDEMLPDEDKLRAKLEMVELEDAIYYQQQIFEKYMQRLNEYETFMDDVHVEAENNFDEMMKDALAIPSNPRLMTALSKWKQQEKEKSVTRQDKTEFYLLIKSEVSNYKKSKKR